jgi:shikimate kinase
LPGNIVLIGFMGTGKTTVGRLLAEQLAWRFVDTDLLIERIAGRPIPDLFSDEGETAFRDRETTALLGVCAGERQVIATGGGAPLREENAAALRGAGIVFWLTARPEIIVERTGRRSGTRPLLLSPDETPLERVLRLLAERGPAYQRAAHRIVDSSDRAPAAVAAEIRRIVAKESAS